MRDSLVMDRIESNLVRLKLSRMYEILGSLARTAEEQEKVTSRFWMNCWKRKLPQRNSAGLKPH